MYAYLTKYEVSKKLKEILPLRHALVTFDLVINVKYNLNKTTFSVKEVV